MSKKVLLKFFIISTIILSYLIAPQISLAQGAADFKSVEFKPSITIPDSEFDKANSVPAGEISKEGAKDKFGIPTEVIVITSNLLAKYIASIYKYATGVGITLAVIMIAVGGVIWLTSAGSPDKIGQAKSYITGAIIGIVLLIGSNLILSSVNTNLTQLKPIETIMLSNIIYGCCQTGEVASTMTQPDCEDIGGVYKKNYSPNADHTKCMINGCCKVLTDTEDLDEINKLKENSNIVPVLCSLRCGCLKSVQDYSNLSTNCAKLSDPDCQTCRNNYINEDATPANSCQDTNNDVCTAINPDAQFKEGIQCSQLNECNGVMVDCFQKSDGSSCENYTGAVKCYCYGGKAFYGKGAENEECGAETGSKCYKKDNNIQTNSDGCDNDKGFYNDWVSNSYAMSIFSGYGRQCEGDLVCCYHSN